MNDNNGKKICPFCNTELTYVIWGYPRLNTPIPLEAGNNRVGFGGCLPCGYEFKCVECERCYTYELEEVKFSDDNPRDNIKLSKEEVEKILELRHIKNKNITFGELVDNSGIVMKDKKNNNIPGKFSLFLNTYIVKGNYKKDTNYEECPKCQGKLCATIIYDKNNIQDDMELYIEDFKCEDYFIPRYRCLLCGKKFGYIDRKKIGE